MGLKVYKECCKNCLLSPDAIVSPKRRKQIITECSKKQTHFICHTATQENKEIVCKTFYDKLGHVSQMIRIAERLDVIEWVDQPEKKKLATYQEITKGNEKVKKFLDNLDE